MTIGNIMIFYRLSLFECFFICCFSYILSLCTGWEIYALLITSLCIIKPLKSWDVKRMHCNTVTGRFRFRMNYNRNSGLHWHIIRSEHVNVYSSLSVYKRDELSVPWSCSFHISASIFPVFCYFACTTRSSFPKRPISSVSHHLLLRSSFLFLSLFH